MKRMLILLVLALTSCGATMRLAGRAPLQDNDGSCASQVLIPNASASVWVHAAWVGPAIGEDSTFVVKGGVFSFNRIVPAGTYTIRVWASDPGGVGCDTTISRTFEAPPERVTVAP